MSLFIEQLISVAGACDPLKMLGEDTVATAALCILGITNDLALTKFEIQIVDLALAVAS